MGKVYTRPREEKSNDEAAVRATRSASESGVKGSTTARE